jgi:hypothetical protein
MREAVSIERAKKNKPKFIRSIAGNFNSIKLN